MSETKQQQLDRIRQAIVDDKVCPELAAGATQLVFGDGHPDADIVFIGEAPGKNEDLQGKPFVGAAGRFLSEMLELIDLKREDVYITNIVKYRPPGNRDPEPAEKKAFLPYLQAQLEVIQPKVVVTLGRHSMNCFLPDLRISQVHGQPKRIRIKGIGRRIKSLQNDKESSEVTQMTTDLDAAGGQGMDALQGATEKRTEPYSNTVKGVSQRATQQRAISDGRLGGSADEQAITTLVVLPLFHPAAALYNGAMRQTLIDDFMAIPAVIAQI